MVTVIIGTQFGDEGKGKIVDLLSQKADYVVRFHGGAGAGHTVVNKYGKTSLHLIPCGIFNTNTICVIASGVMVDAKELLNEIEKIEALGIKVQGRLLISPRSHLVTEYHKVLDGIFDEAKGDLKTATTKRGNGPVHADKVSYYGIQLQDLLDKKTFSLKLRTLLAVKNIIIKQFAGRKIDFKESFREYLIYGRKLKPYLTNTYEVINSAIDSKKNILFEGAHGVFLDNDWGTYPYVTASSILPSNIGAGAGVNPKKIDSVIGVVKAYSTRVDSGAGPFPTEIIGVLAESIRKKGQEFGTTTGRPRRIGWLDLVQIKFAVKLCGIDKLALTKVDILSGLKKILVAIGYKYKNNIVDYLDLTSEQLKIVKPIYKTFEGWQGCSVDTKNYSELPKSLMTYIKFIENFTHCPIRIISIGPDRSSTLLK